MFVEGENAIEYGDGRGVIIRVWLGPKLGSLLTKTIFVTTVNGIGLLLLAVNS